MNDNRRLSNGGILCYACIYKDQDVINLHCGLTGEPEPRCLSCEDFELEDIFQGKRYTEQLNFDRE